MLLRLLFSPMALPYGTLAVRARTNIMRFSPELFFGATLAFFVIPTFPLPFFSPILCFIVAARLCSRANDCNQ